MDLKNFIFLLFIVSIASGITLNEINQGCLVNTYFINQTNNSLCVNGSHLELSDLIPYALIVDENNRPVINSTYAILNDENNRPVINSTYAILNDENNRPVINKTYEKSILGDGIEGRKLKSMNLFIWDGTSANTLKLQTSSLFNGDIIGSTDNVSKSATTGYFTLNANGDTIRIELAGLTGNCIGVISYGIGYNDAGLSFIPNVAPSGGDISFTAFKTDGTGLDLTTIPSGKGVYLFISYLTSA